MTLPDPGADACRDGRGADRTTGMHVSARGWLSAPWRLDGATGTLRYFASPRDDYLEVWAETPPLPVHLLQLQTSAPPDLVVTELAAAAGLGLFRLLPVSARGDYPPEHRLQQFLDVVCVGPLAGAVWDGSTLQLVPIVIALAPPAGEEALLRIPATAVDQEDDPLTPFFTAVEAGQFGWAERHARTILGADSQEGQHVLQCLTVARRTERQLRRSPRDATVQLEHAWALYLLGAFTRAVQHAETALRLEPERSCAHALLGLEAWCSGDAAMAQRRYEQAAAGSHAACDRHVGVLRAVLDGEEVQSALVRLSAASEGDHLAA